MQRTSSLGKGWLGPMSHSEHNGELFRIYDVSDISVSLRDDIYIREGFHKIIHHPNIVPIQWIEKNKVGSPYKAGISLEELILRGGCSDQKVLEYILVRTNELFSFVHSQGWIHGDVHPGLIYLTQDGDITIEGFGRKPQNKETMHTGHHRYLSPEPLGTISSDLYGIGAIMLELALGKNILLGDLLEELHNTRVHKYLQQIKESHPLCASFIELSLHFNPEHRKEAPRLLVSLLGEEPPSQWMTFCQTSTDTNVPYRPDITDPMDIVFHTEEAFEHAFPTSEEITHHELTEDLFVDALLDTAPSNKVNKEEGSSQGSQTMIILLVIISILLIVLVYMQRP